MYIWELDDLGVKCEEMGGEMGVVVMDKVGPVVGWYST